jgi:signal transduction histidine kinase/CheY-like chemotaxis protein
VLGHPHRVWAGCLVAILSTTAVGLVRGALWGVFGDTLLVIPFVVPVMVAGWYGGWKPGLLATALSAFIAAYFFLPPYYSLWVEIPGHVAGLAMFIVCGVTISLLCEAMHADRRRLEAKQRELAQAEAALREIDRRKDEFVATLAHELRNPLAPICNAVNILRAEGPHEPKLKWCEDVIDRQVQQMTRLLDDLLDVSRIAHKKLELRKVRVELTAVVETAVETSRPLIDANHHQLTVTLPAESIYLEADPIRLAQVFSNLLNNAAKYMEKGGQISLTAERQGSDVAISIKDTGIGIAADALPLIFEMFSQATPALERSQGGLGIGLSLVKGLVELHSGTIEARSDGLGQGSMFAVYLPLVVEGRVHEPRPMSESSEQKRGAKCHLLVVDDNRDSADSLARMLTIMGHEVHTAYDGEQAVEAAGAHRPEVILLDIGMPKLNGYDAARRIREQPWGAGMCLIALTGWGQEQDRQRATEAGFNRHLVKPVESAALVKILAELRPATV